jgi:deoxyribose-phosphate aldolase
MPKYTREEVAAAVDLAALMPQHTSVDVSLCCQKAIRFGCASVCVPPYHVPIAARLLEDYPVGVGTVVGFPHGSDSPEIKEQACITALDCGATEIDMVLNIAAMLDGDWETVEAEIEGAVRVCHDDGALLKVILETCYLKDRYIANACVCAANLGVDFVKTSTGYGPGGATPEAVKIMLNAVGPQCQVKASGGIATYADAELYLGLGCTRLGSSRIEELMPDYTRGK